MAKRKEYMGDVKVRDVYSKNALEDQLPLNAGKKYNIEFLVYGKTNGVNIEIPFEKCMDVLKMYERGEVSEGMFPVKIAKPVLALTRCKEGEKPKGWDKVDYYFENVFSYICQAYIFNEYPERMEFSNVSSVLELNERIPLGASDMYNIEREVIDEDGTVIPLMRCREELRCLEDKDIKEDMFSSRILKPLITLIKCEKGEIPKGWNNLTDDFRDIRKYIDESWCRGYEWLRNKDKFSVSSISSIKDLNDFLREKMPPGSEKVYNICCNMGENRIEEDYYYEKIVRFVSVNFEKCKYGETPTGWNAIKNDILETIKRINEEMENDDDDYDYYDD